MMGSAEGTARVSSGKGIDTRVPAVAVGILLIVLLFAPRISIGLVFVLAALPLLWVAVTDVRSRYSIASLPMVGALIFAGYCLAAVSWAVKIDDAIVKWATLLAIILTVPLARIGFAAMPATAARALAAATISGVLLGMTYLLLEEAGGHALKNAVIDLIPALRPDRKHLQIDGDTIIGVAGYMSNRNVAILTLLLWPCALMALSTFERSKGLIVATALALGTIACVVASQHASSRLAIGAAIIAFGISFVSRRTAVLVVAAGWIVATLLTVPIAKELRAQGLHMASWVPLSFKARVILWGYTADRVPERFWRGTGLNSTKPLDAARKDSWVTRPGHVYPERTGQHAHNIFLQTWYELGAFGAATLMLFGLALLTAIDRLPQRVAPFALATFTGAAALGATSWGFWQPWFMGGYGLAAVILMLAFAVAEKNPLPDPAAKGGA